MSTSKKSNPALWKRIVASVKSGSKGGRAGQWSARKAQLAVQRYKKAGGKYKGAKSSSNSLSKWTKQDWGYVSPKDAQKPRAQRGRYLPKSVRSSMSSSQKQEANRRKRAASKAGKQKASYQKSVAKKVRKAK
jgi:hypothetical protein